ncbi:MAG: RNA polymerase sigma factor [Phycisphaerales bacterium JB040]
MTQSVAIALQARETPDLGPEPAREDAERGLIERAKRDPRAYAELYRMHYGAIAGYLLRRTGDRHVAEDLASETFLSAWKALGRFRDRGAPFRAWLMRIATNKANRWSRDRKRRSRHATALGAPATPAEASERAGDVQRALLGLAERDQSVLVLHHVEGLSVARVADVLGVREGTVKSRLARARERMRAALETTDTQAVTTGGVSKEVSS